MFDYFEKARELGKLLTDTPESKRFEDAKTAFESDETAVSVFNEFKSYQLEVSKKLKSREISQDKLDEIYKELEMKVHETQSHPLIGELAAAETEYYSIINQTLDIIKAAATGEMDSGCDKNCSSGCNGCH